MNVRIYPCTLNGDVEAPASKSGSLRAFFAAAFSDKPCDIVLSATSEDIKATISCLVSLGAKIEKKGDVYRVTPIKTPKNALFDCGESGSTFRFLLPVVAALGAGGAFTGRGRLPERPIGELLSALGGCSFSSKKLPFIMNGKLCGGVFTLPGNVSSQYVTGLLFALPLVGGEILLFTPLESKSYVNLTARVLESFGVRVIETENGYKTEGRYRSPARYVVEGDWSNAAFFIVASAIGNLVRVKNLSSDTAQGDSAIKNLLLGFKSRGTVIDAGDVPDLVPALSVAAAYSCSPTRIQNAARLRLKECDRLHAVAHNLTALGVKAEEFPDGLLIEGKGGVNGGTVSSFNDHRIVMSFAIAATKAAAPVVIEGAEAVNKSYPSFFEEFKKLGGKFDVV